MPCQGLLLLLLLSASLLTSAHFQALFHDLKVSSSLCEKKVSMDVSRVDFIITASYINPMRKEVSTALIDQVGMLGEGSYVGNMAPIWSH